MQAIKEALYQKAIANDPIVTLLGGPRISYRNPKHTVELPSVTYFEVYDGGDVEIPRAEGLYQFDVWARTAGEAEAVSVAIRDAFHRQGLEPVGRRVTEILWEPPIREFDEFDTDTIFHRVVQFRVISYPA